MTEAKPPALPAIGDVVAGRYRIVSQLGKGGMGAVFVVERVGAGDRFAMKTLLPGLMASRELVLRFEREAKAASLLGHPNIVDVLDFGALPDGTLFLVMELVEGTSLADAIDRGALAPSRALEIARQILDALAHAHDHGIIHRDIKPDNVMLTEAGVKLLDFGIVKVIGDAAELVGGEKLTRAGVVFGSPDYMAPEQALGQEVDQRADLYSVGVLLFEMLARRRPFEHDDMMELVRMQIGRPPPTLAHASRGRVVAPALEAIVARALAKQRDERFANAREMIAELERAAVDLAAQTALALPPAPPSLAHGPPPGAFSPPAPPPAAFPPPAFDARSGLPPIVLLGATLFIVFIVILIAVALS